MVDMQALDRESAWGFLEQEKFPIFCPNNRKIAKIENNSQNKNIAVRLEVYHCPMYINALLEMQPAWSTHKPTDPIQLLGDQSGHSFHVLGLIQGGLYYIMRKTVGCYQDTLWGYFGDIGISSMFFCLFVGMESSPLYSTT